VEANGVEGDLWLPLSHTGRVEPLGADLKVEGPLFAGFRARHRFHLKEQAILEETWSVRLFHIEGRYVLDLHVSQEALVDLKILEYRYGGIGFRGPLDWEGKDGMAVVTNNGLGRVDAQGSRPAWTVLNGKGGSVGLTAHTSNFRSPESVRVHPDEPFFNWSIPADGDFQVLKGKTLEVRYRIVLGDEPIQAPSMDALAKAFTAPSTAMLTGP
jgi:hypothetical protein